MIMIIGDRCKVVPSRECIFFRKFVVIRTKSAVLLCAFWYRFTGATGHRVLPSGCDMLLPFASECEMVSFLA